MLGPGRDPESVEAGAIRTLAGFLVSFDQSELGVFWPLYQGQNVLGRKAASAGLDIEIDIHQTAREGEIIEMGVNHRIVEKSGAWYAYKGEKIGQGKDNARDFLKENPDVAREIENRIREAVGIVALNAVPAEE